jgi:hypothetical protein
MSRHRHQTTLQDTAQGSQNLLSEFKIQITSSTFADHNGMMPEINNKKEAGRSKTHGN